MSLALMECKNKKIMHRDISSNNVMINIATREGLLIDFDQAADLRTQAETGTDLIASRATYFDSGTNIV